MIFVPWRALAEQTREKLDVCGLRTPGAGLGTPGVARFGHLSFHEKNVPPMAVLYLVWFGVILGVGMHVEILV